MWGKTVVPDNNPSQAKNGFSSYMLVFFYDVNFGITNWYTMKIFMRLFSTEKSNKVHGFTVHWMTCLSVSVLITTNLVINILKFTFVWSSVCKISILLLLKWAKCCDIAAVCLWKGGGIHFNIDILGTWWISITHLSSILMANKWIFYYIDRSFCLIESYEK